MILYNKLFKIYLFLKTILSKISKIKENKKSEEGGYIELLKLKNDYTFKRVFGYTGNEEITKGLLNAILREEVTEVNLNCNTILERDLYDDKLGILDIRAKVNNAVDINIEMQLVDEKNIEKRVVFYLSKMYTQNLKQSHNYSELNKYISILFIDFELDRLKEIPKYLTKWNIREETYGKIKLTEVLELYIINLSKIDKYSENKILDTWVKFISNSEDLNMENADESIKKAKEVLDEISEDEHEQYLAHLREKYIFERQGIEEAGFDKGMAKGLEEGIEKGIEQGIKKGIEQEKRMLAQKLKEDNVDIEKIIKYTGLTKEEIEKL